MVNILTLPVTVAVVFLLISMLGSSIDGMQIDQKKCRNHHHDTTCQDNRRRNFISRTIKTAAATAASVFLATGPSPSFAATTSSGEIGSRLEPGTTLVLPQPSYASELNGIDNTYYPDWLAGEWDVTQTLVDAQTPLGLKFVGGPNGLIDIAEKTMTEAKSKLGVPVKLQLKYQKTKWGVAEDRIFNNKARLNGFAGKDVVASVQYADVGGSNRKSVLALGGSEDDPLQTTLVYFKGPAAQKNFVTSHGGEKLQSNDNQLESWAGYEVQRSIFALTNQNTAPPITTDTEYIWMFEKEDDNHIQGKLRIAGYLNAQSDTLYFEARNRAVSFQDYTLDMRRI
mmetsp:Transcript_48725/g.117877  ORF Transcript_48725/g.117877 Transcript_48725/m.117877 type:complete len:340 (+) Transcript_48725:328-1347(+)